MVYYYHDILLMVYKKFVKQKNILNTKLKMKSKNSTVQKENESNDKELN